MDTHLPYDKTNPKSIEQHAIKLLNKSLRILYGNSIEQDKTHKGKLGQLVEELHFHYKPNSKSKADFSEAGVELKTTPIKQIKKGFSAKERVIFGIINFKKEYKTSFEESGFWKKNAFILLMFYLYKKDQLDIDAIFKIIRLWRFPDADLRIIMDDWGKIIHKIKLGKAHEISESDTLYLGACTKGANKNSTRKQPFSDIPAMQRAFSLKPKYLNYIISISLPANEEIFNKEEYGNLLKSGISLAAEPIIGYIGGNTFAPEPIVKDINEYKKGETFEDLVIRKFKTYYGWSEQKLMSYFNIRTIAKSKYAMIAKAILGIKGEQIEEFLKADILMKTVRLQFAGTLKESMSFKQIKFKEIINEEWELSTWYEELNRRFFFIIFQEDENGVYKLCNVKFWALPPTDMNILQSVWEDTKNKIKINDFDNFIKASDKKIGHVRPKGRDSQDLMETQDGSMQKKKCFWLNSSYIVKKIL